MLVCTNNSKKYNWTIFTKIQYNILTTKSNNTLTYNTHQEELLLKMINMNVKKFLWVNFTILLIYLINRKYLVYNEQFLRY